MDRDQILSQRVVEGMIADGDIIVMFQDCVLRLNSWIEKHPGGHLVISHMVGRDATDEMTASHSAETLRTMKAYRIGRKQMGPWPNKTPPIRGGIFRRLDALDALPGTSDPSDVPDLISESDTDDDAASDRLSDTSGRSSLTSLTSESISVDAEKHPRDASAAAADFISGLRKRTTPHGAGAAEDGLSGSVYEPLASTPPSGTSMTTAEYTAWAVQLGVDRGVRDYPSVDPAVQQDIVEKYRIMHDKVRDEGLYDCPYVEYGKEICRYLTLFSLFLTFLHNEWYITSAVFLGLFWHQLMFTAHDAGHRAITHIFVVDTLIGMFIADFCCGLSIGWWKSSHNVHHLITNHPEHDPDIQNVPLFATCPSFFTSLRSSYYDFTFVWDAVADFMVPYQKYTYYPIMGVARFNLYLLSWLHVLSSKASALGHSKAWWIRPGEIIFMGCYWYIFGYKLVLCTLPTWPIRVAFVLVSHIILMPLHVQITLSHWGMSTSELGESESFAQRQLRTTSDVDCPKWLDFIHGGLQFQAVHHLFPRMPRHNLRKAQVHVRQFCKETKIPYSIHGFEGANRQVLGRLEEVGDQVKMMLNCQKHMAETGDSGLH